MLKVGERIKNLEAAQVKHRAAVVRITSEIKVLRSKCKHEWPATGEIVECGLCGTLGMQGKFDDAAVPVCRYCETKLERMPNCWRCPLDGDVSGCE